MGLILWIIIGGLAGWIASKINGTDSQQGWIGNIAMGIIGAIVGGIIWNALFGDDGDGIVDISLGGFLVAIGGALLVSFVMGKLTGKRAL